MVKAIFNLIRLPNLIIVALTQVAMRYLIMEPLLPHSNFSLQFGTFQFVLLVLSTVFIAAAGYIINDYFDTQTDRINKPDKVYVGVSIKRRTVMLLHWIFNLLGVGIGIYLSLYISLLSMSLIFFLASGLLWFYSVNYKRQLLIGNLTVSFLTAMVPMIVVLFEIPMLNREYGAIMLQYNGNFNYIFIWVAGFSIFAFLSTLIREIIKDTEDFEGDAAYGMKTLPIVAGTRLTKAILVTLIMTIIAALVFVLLKFIMFSGIRPDFYSMAYFLVFLVIPFIILLTMVILATGKEDYHRASIMIKFIMLFGVLYSVLVFFLVKFWV